MITANDTESDEVTGLTLGADDYITKPFSLMALRARVDNIRKRAEKPRKQIYEEAGYRFDFEKLEFYADGQLLHLSAPEQKLLKLLEKLQTGRCLLYSVDVDDDSRLIADRVKYHVGDTVTLRYEDGTAKEYEIVSVVKGHIFSLTNQMSSTFFFYVSADEFRERFSDAYLMSFLFDTKERQEAEMEAFLEQYTTEEEPVMAYESREVYAKSFDGIPGMIAAVGLGLAGMLVAEGVDYAVLTIGFSVVAASLFSVTALRSVGEGLWFIRYRFTLLPVALACPVLLVLGIAVPRAVYALRKKESVVEALRE